MGPLILAAATMIPLVITEMRWSGPAGPADEFIEIRNESSDDHIVRPADASSGYALAGSDGRIRFVIPAGTRIPAGGHFLAASTAYSLGSYAMPDLTYEEEIPSGTGVALFASSAPANFDRAHRIAAMGPATEDVPLYRSGSGFRESGAIAFDRSVYRVRGVGNPDGEGSLLRVVSVDAPAISSGIRLGAPGPQNLASPSRADRMVAMSLLDPSVAAGAAPNLVREGNAIAFRRRIRNSSDTALRAVRLRMEEMTTWPAVGDLRLRSGRSGIVHLSDGEPVEVEGLILEEPPRQRHGGGANSSLTLRSITPKRPLEPGQEIAVEMLFEVQQEGPLSWSVVIEATPGAGSGPNATSMLEVRPDRLHPQSDFDGDGRSDIVWRHRASGANAVWLMHGADRRGLALPARPAAWEIAAVADFQGDCHADLLWRNPATGENEIWLLSGASVAAVAPLPPVHGRSWIVAATGDFQRDGKPDLIWRNGDTGANSLWLLDGTGVAVTAALPSVSAEWTLAAAGDFQGDGKTDLMWRHAANGDTSVWFIDGTSIAASAALPHVDPSWSIAGAGDFQGDRIDDVLWQNRAAGEAVLWFMNGAVAASIVLHTMPRGFLASAIGDFQGDGRADVLWRDPATGTTIAVQMNGSDVFPSKTEVVQPSWQIVP